MTGNYKQNIIIEHKKKKKNISIDSVFTRNKRGLGPGQSSPGILLSPN